MNVLYYLLVIIFIQTDARLFEGQCRDIPAPVVKPFSVEYYMGVWYEILWYDDEYPTFDECLQFTYIQTPNYNSHKTFTTKLKLQDSTDSFARQTYYGVGKQFENGNLGTASSPTYPTVSNYHVLSTNYVQHSFVWDCFNVNATHYNERMWYFDRQPNPSCYPSEVNGLLKKFDPKYIRKTYHLDKCNYLNVNNNN